MATVDKAFADRIIAGNGFLPECGEEAPDNPRCIKIVKYDNAFGGTSYGVVFNGELHQDRYEMTTEYVKNPVVYWQYQEVE